MITVRKQFSGPAFGFAERGTARIERPLFFDIETTGLIASRSRIYLIGCARALPDTEAPDGYELLLFFAETPGEERQVILAFLETAAEADTLVHYNGERFDLRFLRERIEALGLAAEEHCADLLRAYSSLQSLDLYRFVKDRTAALGLPDGRLRSVERLLAVSRGDDTSGGELIPVYLEYVSRPSSAALDRLLHHNESDVIALVKLSVLPPCLDYLDGGFRQARLCGISEHLYRSLDGQPGRELFLDLSLSGLSLPAPLCVHRDGFFLRIEGDTGRLRVPVTEGELRYFHPDPENYYYLPAEDMAVHKSVSSFVDKTHRVRATKANCYTKKHGTFLPLPTLPAAAGTPPFPCGLPRFRSAYDSAPEYIEYHPENEKDMNDYLVHVLSCLASGNVRPSRASRRKTTPSA